MAGAHLHGRVAIHFIARVGWPSYSGQSQDTGASPLLNYIALTTKPQLDNIGDAFPNAQWRYWIVNAAILVQAALGPVFSSISDVFQVRKSVIVSLVTLAFIGSTIIPNSDSIYRVIGGSVMIGFGLAAAPLSYAVPSEIVPRRWRSGETAPLSFLAERADIILLASQGFINLFGGLGAITGPLVSEWSITLIVTVMSDAVQLGNLHRKMTLVAGVIST